MKHTRKLFVLAAGVVGAMGMAAAGWAYWSTGGSGSASAGVGTLNAPTNVVATATAGSGTVPVSWTPSTTAPPAVAPTGYYVQRFSGSTPSAACASSPSNLVTTNGCNDLSVADGTYTYRVTAVLRSWTAQSAATSSVTVVNDATPPTVSSINRVAGAANPTNAGSVSWAVTFSESVTGVDTGDFDLARTGPLTGGSVTNVTGSGTTWTVTAGTGTGDGTLGLNLVDDDTIVDGVGNKLGGAGNGNGNKVGAEYSIDKTAPTVISINRVGSSLTNAASVSWTVAFSESISGADTSDFALAAGGVSGASITSASGLSFTVIADTGTGDGTLGLNLVDDDTITDAAGNKLGGTGTGNGDVTGQVYTIDKSTPTVTVNQAAGQADPTKTSPINFTVIFSESVTTFTNTDITVGGSAGGTKTVNVTGSGTTYNVAISGMTDGTVIPTIAAGTAPDAAGNNNLASTSSDNSVTYDTTGPTVTVNQAAGQADPTKTSPINFTVVFSEAVTTFTNTDITVGGSAGGTKTVNVTGSGTTYNVAISGMTDGTVIPTIAAGTAPDAAGNNNLASTSSDNSVTYDTTGPTVTVNQAAGQADPTKTSPINFTVVFSEAVTTFTNTDITVGGSAGGTKTVNVTGSGTTYNVAISGMTDGTVIPTIAAGTAPDAAGNNNLASTSSDNSLTYDATVPTASAIATTSGATAGKPEVNDTVTFTFSELVAPGSIYSGWSAASQPDATNAKITFNDSTTGNGTNQNNDSFTVTGAAGTTLNLGTVAGIQGQLVATNGGSYSFTATLRYSENGGKSIVTVTLTSLNSGGAAVGTATGNIGYTWTSVSGVTDLAGNALATTPKSVSSGLAF